MHRMDHEYTSTPPADADPREFALQLAVIAERLDERSAQAVVRVEAASARLEREATGAAHALAAERRQAATAQQLAAQSHIRLLWIASAGLLVGALVAVAGATFAVASAKRELASIARDQALLQAIYAADVTLCGDRLCARVVHAGEEAGEYHPIAPRPL